MKLIITSLLLLFPAAAALGNVPWQKLQGLAPPPPRTRTTRRGLDDGPFTDELICSELLAESYGDDVCSCERQGDEFIVICEDICETCEEEFDFCTEFSYYEQRTQVNQDTEEFVPTYFKYTYDQTGMDSSNSAFSFEEIDGACGVFIDDIKCQGCSTVSEECDDGILFDCSNVEDIESPVLDGCDESTYIDMPPTSPFYGFFSLDFGVCLEEAFLTPPPTMSPTAPPTPAPSMNTTQTPTSMPSMNTTQPPTYMPSMNTTKPPTSMPSMNTTEPSTSMPSMNTTEPSTHMPSMNTTKPPTSVPSMNMTEPPTPVPSTNVTEAPVSNMTVAPTMVPSSIELFSFTMALEANSLNTVELASTMEDLLAADFLAVFNNTVGVNLVAEPDDPGMNNNYTTTSPESNTTTPPASNMTGPPTLGNATSIPTAIATKSPVVSNMTSSPGNTTTTNTTAEDNTLTRRRRRRLMMFTISMSGEVIFAGTAPSSADVVAQQIASLGDVMGLQEAINANPSIGMNVTVTGVDIAETTEPTPAVVATTEPTPTIVVDATAEPTSAPVVTPEPTKAPVATPTAKPTTAPFVTPTGEPDVDVEPTAVPTPLDGAGSRAAADIISGLTTLAALGVAFVMI